MQSPKASTSLTVRRQDSSWINATLDKAIVGRANFTSADLRAARLSNVRGTSVLDGALLVGTTARGSRDLPRETRVPTDNVLPAFLDGHTSIVLSVAWAPDGRRLASASADRSIRLWDAETGGRLATSVGRRDGWYTLDERGRWFGEGAALRTLFYTEAVERMPPAPWIPRYWRAVDLPEYMSPSATDRERAALIYTGEAEQ